MVQKNPIFTITKEFECATVYVQLIFFQSLLQIQDYSKKNFIILCFGWNVMDKGKKVPQVTHFEINDDDLRLYRISNEGTACGLDPEQNWEII